MASSIVSNIICVVTSGNVGCLLLCFFSTLVITISNPAQDEIRKSIIIPRLSRLLNIQDWNKFTPPITLIFVKYLSINSLPKDEF